MYDFDLCEIHLLHEQFITVSSSTVCESSEIVDLFAEYSSKIGVITCKDLKKMFKACSPSLKNPPGRVKMKFENALDIAFSKAKARATSYIPINEADINFLIVELVKVYTYDILTTEAVYSDLLACDKDKHEQVSFPTVCGSNEVVDLFKLYSSKLRPGFITSLRLTKLFKDCSPSVMKSAGSLKKEFQMALDIGFEELILGKSKQYLPINEANVKFLIVKVAKAAKDRHVTPKQIYTKFLACEYRQSTPKGNKSSEMTTVHNADFHSDNSGKGKQQLESRKENYLSTYKETDTFKETTK